MVIHLNEKLCVGCQLCLEVCPTGCFEFDEQAKKARLILPLSCLDCKACELNCEGNAIKIEKSLFQNFFAQLI